MVIEMRTLIIVSALAITGCANTVVPVTASAPMNCATAGTEIPYLEQQFSAFQVSRKGWPETAQDRQWVNTVKTRLWYLRTACANRSL